MSVKEQTVNSVHIHPTFWKRSQNSVQTDISNELATLPSTCIQAELQNKLRSLSDACGQITAEALRLTALAQKAKEPQRSSLLSDVEKLRSCIAEISLVAVDLQAKGGTSPIQESVTDLDD